VQTFQLGFIFQARQLCAKCCCFRAAFEFDALLGFAARGFNALTRRVTQVINFCVEVCSFLQLRRYFDTQFGNFGFFRLLLLGQCATFVFRRLRS
jgi:hypothetical protein